ncbi:hypothetical protein BH09ACT12_BH09ACT12_35290 [soil metagenome]
MPQPRVPWSARGISSPAPDVPAGNGWDAAFGLACTGHAWDVMTSYPARCHINAHGYFAIAKA